MPWTATAQFCSFAAASPCWRCGAPETTHFHRPPACQATHLLGPLILKPCCLSQFAVDCLRSSAACSSGWRCSRHSSAAGVCARGTAYLQAPLWQASLGASSGEELCLPGFFMCGLGNKCADSSSRAHGKRSGGGNAAAFQWERQTGAGWRQDSC